MLPFLKFGFYSKLKGHGPTQPKRIELDAAEHQGYDFGSLVKRMN